jgi:hypothetical protein
VADYDDPGWRAAIRGVGWFIFPLAHLWMWRQRERDVGLLSLRRIYLSLIDSMFLFFVAFAFIAPWDGGDGRVDPDRRPGARRLLPGGRHPHEQTPSEHAKLERSCDLVPGEVLHLDRIR